MIQMQEFYIEELEVKPEAIELGDQYCAWSATLTVQSISQHYQEDQKSKEHVGMGQPLVYTYMSSPKRKPKENIRINKLEFFTDVYKLVTRLKRT